MSGRGAFLDHCSPVSFQTRYDLRIIRVAHTRARVDDDVDCRQLALVQAKGLAHQALDAITPYRVADDLRRHRQTEPRVPRSIAAREDCKQLVGEAARLAIDAVELGFFPETLRRLKRPCSTLQVGGRTNTRRVDARLTR